MRMGFDIFLKSPHIITVDLYKWCELIDLFLVFFFFRIEDVFLRFVDRPDELRGG